MKLDRIPPLLLRGAWFALVILLPVTSFPLVVKLVRSDVVGLPSGIILGVITAACYLPSLLKGGKLPVHGIPLLMFVLAALFSTCRSVFLSIPPYKGNTPLGEGLSSYITLAVGVFTFLVTARMTEKPGRLQWTFRLLNYSGAFILVWSLVQAVVWRLIGGYPWYIELFHRFFSTGVLYADRVTGLALEPSWFAHQLNMLYLPLWLSATISRYSAHRRRILGISWENVLLVLGVINLVLSMSRIGYLSLLMMLFVFFVRMNGQLLNIITSWAAKKMNWNADKTESLSRYQKKRRRLRVGLFIAMLCVYLSLVIVGALALSRLDDRMSTLFEVDFTQDHWLYRYLGKMDLGPRVSFWLGGWQVFESHPIFGVGLGNSGFFFMDAMPDYAWSFPEVRSLMLGGSGVLNPKNLWSRLLAETGIVGFFLFAAWMLSLWKTADELSRKSSPLLRQVGWMGLFVCAALTTEGFSVDSFALPYYWFSLGLVVSAYQQAQETSERL